MITHNIRFLMENEKKKTKKKTKQKTKKKQNNILFSFSYSCNIELYYPYVFNT